MFKNKLPAFSLWVGVGSGFLVMNSVLNGRLTYLDEISRKLTILGIVLYFFLINVVFLFLASWLFQGFGEGKLLLAGLTLI